MVESRAVVAIGMQASEAEIPVANTKVPVANTKVPVANTKASLTNTKAALTNTKVSSGSTEQVCEPACESHCASLFNYTRSLSLLPEVSKLARLEMKRFWLEMKRFFRLLRPDEFSQFEKH